MAGRSFPLQMGVCLAPDQRLDSSNSAETTRVDGFVEKPTAEENRSCQDSFYPKVLCIGNLRHVAPYFLQKNLNVGKLAHGKTIAQALGIGTVSIDHKNNRTIVKDVALVDWWPKELLANRLEIVNTRNLPQPKEHPQVTHNSTIRIATPDHVIREGEVLRGRYHFHEQSVLETPRPTIVYQDEHYIVVNKPGGIDVLSNPDAHRVINSLPGIVMGMLDRAGNHGYSTTTEQVLPSSSLPPKPIMTIVPAHRIDNPVSGLVCCGRTNKDAKRLSRKIQSRETIKTYLARVHISSDRAMEQLKKLPLEIEVPLSFDSSKRCAVVDFSDKGKPSRTSILAVLQEAAAPNHPSGTCVIAVRPHTGRKHQLRKHLSHVGLPIANDEKYNTTTSSFTDGLDGNDGGDCSCSEYSSRTISAFGLPNPPKEVVKLFEDHYLDHCAHCQYVRKLLGTTKAKPINATPENLAAATTAAELFKKNMGPSVSQPIWLHSWRYKFPSLGLSFEAPPPEWAQLRQSMDTGTFLLHNGVLD